MTTTTRDDELGGVEMEEQMRLAAQDPGGYLATVLWHTAIGMQAGLGERGIILAGEEIIGALAACAVWALRDVPYSEARARYTKQFLDIVRDGVEEEEMACAKSERKSLHKSELH